MNYNRIKFSIIIPHYNSLDSLPRLLNSIPEREDLEVIIVDNSPIAIYNDDINSRCKYKLLYSSNSRFAGGARNVGLEAAIGKWLIFADADDFFTPDAFDIFDSYADSENDLIYFKVSSVYDNTMEPTERCEEWNHIINNFLSGAKDEISTKLSYVVPWGKMVKREFVIKYNIVFDEVVTANDVMFSTLCAYYSEAFTVSESVVYTVTTRKGSLANRRDLRASESRYSVALRRNKFLKEHQLGKHQGSVMYHLFNIFKLDKTRFICNLCLAFKYKQNLFIGCRNWLHTYKYWRDNDKKNQTYLSRNV